MNRVSLIRIRERTARIVAGSVVSSTCSCGWPFTWPNVFLNTSGHRLDPPMPSKTTSEYVRPSAASCSNSGACSSIFSATFSHPRRSRTASRWAGSDVHSVESLAHKRRGASPFWSWAMRASTFGCSSPRLYHCRGPLPDLMFWLSFLMVASRLSNDFVKDSTPSTSSSRVTWSRSTPNSASCFSCRLARPTFSSMLRLASPCSRNAARVAGGIVSTVSGPMSSST